MSKPYSKPFLLLYTKPTAMLLVKFTLIFVAFFFIYNKLVHNDTLDINSLLYYIEKHDIITFRNVLILFIFSGFNWFLECLKWQLLVREIKIISLKKAVEQSLGSLTASIITPNRIGEYGAKAIYFKKKYRKKIMGLNLVGNLSQMSTTLFFGAMGLIYSINIFKLPISYFKLISFVILTTGVIIAYYKFLSKKEFEIKGYSFKKLNRFISNLNRDTLYMSILIAVLRYVCFSHQFYFLICLLGIDITYIEALALITSMYLLVSVIPTVFVFDVLVKGSVAVWLFSFVNANEFIIVTCITIMWFLNFALPSIIGSYFVLNFKLQKDQ
jgi:hypothetical protein